MDKDDDYLAPMPAPSFNASMDYSLDHQRHQQYPRNHEQQEQQFVSSKFRIGSETPGGNNNVMVDYMLNNTQHHQQQSAEPSSGFYGSSSFDKFSFADVMQFADFGPKLALNQTKNPEESGVDPVYLLKFPVLNENRKFDLDHQNLMTNADSEDKLKGVSVDENSRQTREEKRQVLLRDDEDVRAVSDINSVQLSFLGEDLQKNSQQGSKNKRKRPRTIKTIAEVESQRMTHIAVERNRRKQMNEHLRVLRSLMPGSYVQRGDQASIIGGAIEFVRELEQLLQCLESQKRRRLSGEGAATTRQPGDSSTLVLQQSNLKPPLMFSPSAVPNEQMKLAMEFETGLREETPENKSCLAAVEVKLLGFDATIKILSRRIPGQLIKIIAALEDLQLNILHTNITTNEQTVLYSFNVKVAIDSRFTAEDIATSVQQILSFIHANNDM